MVINYEDDIYDILTLASRRIENENKEKEKKEQIKIELRRLREAEYDRNREVMRLKKVQERIEEEENAKKRRRLERKNEKIARDLQVEKDKILAEEKAEISKIERGKQKIKLKEGKGANLCRKKRNHSIEILSSVFTCFYPPADLLTYLFS